MPASSEALVAALAHALGADLIETHISWVLLARDTALKIKKPLRLPFVDYSTLERRRHFCEEEVRLNRRLAPAVYQGVATVTGACDAPLLDGTGPVLEYAVRMRRFPPGALFSEQLAAGTLALQSVDELAVLLAGFHLRAPQADGKPGSDAPSLPQRALAALNGARAALTEAQQALLADWIESQGRLLQPLWTARREQGRVRECHGDLHLDNIVSLQGKVAAFDAIEFDPALRWIDVIDDVSFTLMDFAARGRPDLGWRFINGWLDLTGDHGALPALRFSVVYRALVRSQVAQLREPESEAARRYARTALDWAALPQPHLFIMHGLPGSGKTFVSQQLLQDRGAIRLRSDVERKRLFGLGMLADSQAAGLDLYDAQATRRTYQHLYDTARTALAAGYPVIIDAAFLRGDERAQARALALELGVPFSIVTCEAPLEVLRQRLLARRGDASEADLAVLEKLRLAAEPLSETELAWRHRQSAAQAPQSIGS